MPGIRTADGRYLIAAGALYLLTLGAPLSAQPSHPFQDLAQELAAKIAAEVQSARQVTLSIAASADNEQTAMFAVEAEIRRLLASRGIDVVERADAAATLQIGCSRNLRERVCTCAVRHGGTRRVVVATRPLDARDDPATLWIELIPVFSQRMPIYDVALAGDRLLVLDPGRITLYEREPAERAGERWKPRQAKPIPSSRPWPRDTRGMLRVEGTTLTAWLPGVVCRGSVDLERFVCADEHGAVWPIGIENSGVDAARNYFYTPEGLPFYSAAPLAGDAEARWIVVANAGELLLLDGSRRSIGTARYTDAPVAIVTLDTLCASGVHLLIAASATDERRTEALVLSRVVKHQLVPASARLALPGRLTALWPAPGSSDATAVIHDPSDERYEAFQVRIACS
jgi:hypothetical protein